MDEKPSSFREGAGVVVALVGRACGRDKKSLKKPMGKAFKRTVGCERLAGEGAEKEGEGRRGGVRAGCTRTAMMEFKAGEKGSVDRFLGV